MRSCRHILDLKLRVEYALIVNEGEFVVRNDIDEVTADIKR